MQTIIKNIVITRGNSYGFNFEITDEDDQEVELDAAYFSCKENPDDESYVFQESIGHGITKLNDGGYYVKIKPDDTKDLNLFKFYYDLEIRIDDDVYTPLKGRLNITWDVTKEN